VALTASGAARTTASRLRVISGRKEVLSMDGYEKGRSGRGSEGVMMRLSEAWSEYNHASQYAHIYAWLMCSCPAAEVIGVSYSRILKEDAFRVTHRCQYIQSHSNRDRCAVACFLHLTTVLNDGDRLRLHPYRNEISLAAEPGLSTNEDIHP
jgi:hypothetical protein